MSDGTQQRFLSGAEVMPGVVLSQVLSDRVVLTRDGRSEILRMFDRGGAIVDPTPRPSAPAPATARRVRADAFAGAVDIVPVQESGRLTGYRIVARGDGSALRDAGLSPGDIIRTVNGTPVGQADPSVLTASIGPGKTLSLGVLRSGSTLNLRLEFE
jgi:general secretion pathway protein C